MGGKSNITTSSDTATTDATNKNSMVDNGNIYIYNEYNDDQEHRRCGIYTLQEYPA